MSWKKVYEILDLSLWIINPLLIVLAVFDHQIQPGLFAMVGQISSAGIAFSDCFWISDFHLLPFFQHKRIALETEKLLLAGNALLASIVAAFGILLSLGNAYEAELINWHKWGGVAVAILSWSFIYVLNLNVSFKKVVG